MRIFFQDLVYENTHFFPIGKPGPTIQPLIIAHTLTLWILNHRQPILYADEVAQFADSPATAMEITKFACAVRLAKMRSTVGAFRCFLRSGF